MKKIGLLVLAMVLLFGLIGCSSGTTPEPPSAASDEQTPPASMEPSMDELTKQENKAFIDLFYYARGADTAEKQVLAAEKLQQQGVVVNGISEKDGVYGVETVLAFYQKVLAGQSAQLTVCTIENEIFQTDTFYVGDGVIRHIEKTIPNVGNEGAQEQLYLSVKTETEQLTDVSLTNTGYLAFLNTDTDQDQSTSFTVKLYNYENQQVSNEINESLCKKYGNLLLNNPMLEHNWNSPDKIDPDYFLYFVEDVYQQQKKELITDFPLDQTKPIMTVVIPYQQAADIIRQYFNVAQSRLMQSKFYSKEKNAFFYEMGRGGGGMALEAEQSIVSADGTLTLVLNMKNAESGKRMYSANLKLKLDSDGKYRYFSNTAIK